MRAAAIDYSGLPVTVMGLGLFGGGATVARHLARRGARVTVTDQRSAAELAPALSEIADLDVRFVLGEHRQEDFTRARLVVANPAVPPQSPYLAAARAAGVPITSETALFLEVCPARIAAITGTQGKSSTCHTLHQLLVASGMSAHLGGNIGRSLLEEAETMRAGEVVVLELSSYQLDALPRDIGSQAEPPAVETVCVVNVLADHIERHGSIEAYAAAKRRILELVRASGGTAVLPAEDPWTGAWRDGGLRRVDAWLRTPSDRGLNLREGLFRSDELALGRVDDLHIPGTFQRENTLLALGMAQRLGARPERLAAAIAGLRGLPHRLEDLGVFDGHRVIDNGVSTTPDSTLSAVLSLTPGFTLLAGGKAKNLPLDELVAACRGRVRRVVIFGSASATFAPAFAAAGIETQSAPTVSAAVATAFEHMRPGEELLFSPACASFDAYLNFRERAFDFRRALPAHHANAPA